MRIGVDLGATEIEAVALDGAGAVRARRRVAMPSQILPCPGGGPG